MTYDELMEKYGDVTMYFVHYYKYMFTFEGETEEGEKIVCSDGGDVDNIYRWEVSPEMKLHELSPNRLLINGKEIELDW